jgi:hypothetical protein
MTMDTTMLATTHLGPARVTRIDSNRVLVESDGQERAVVLAMVVRYQPRIDDVLLVASNAETCYAIGVLAGSGSVELASTGDVTLTAGGRVRIQAQDAVTTDAPLVRTQAGRLELLATDLLASAQSFLQRVAGLLHLQAGRRHTQVEGSSIENARQVVIKAQETVTVDGSTIHLG